MNFLKRKDKKEEKKVKNPCPECNGRGVSKHQKCPRCNGKKVE